MHRLDLHPRGWRRRLLSERGMAMPTVLLALVAAFGLAAATVVASVNSQGGSVRDQNTKAALGAAEAGVANALVRFNRIPTDGTTNLCDPVGGGAAINGWCPQVVQPEALDRGGYAYWVRPTLAESESEIVLEIVSTGTVDGVTRRIEVEARSAQAKSKGTQPFGEFSVIGLDYIDQKSNSTIAGNVATNGDITLAANANLICDIAQVGEGQSIYGSSECAATHGSVWLPPVNQGDVATNNDNHRITLAKSGQPGGDTISGNPSRVEWNPEARTLRLRQNASLTLGGANYSLCTLQLENNTNLFIVAGAHVRIYFDSPEACGLTDGAIQLDMSSNSSIEATGSDPGSLALLFVGSETETISTKIILASNTQADGPCEQSFVLYAPRTDLELASNTHICGALAAKSITASSFAKVTTSSLASEFELPNTETRYYFGYGPGTFVECSAAPPTPPAPPDAGC